MTPNNIIKSVSNIINNSQIIAVGELHTQVTHSIISELHAIIANTDTPDNVKITQVYILIEGWTMYLTQFGLDKQLVEYSLELNKECWLIQNVLLLHTLIDEYHTELEKTVLFFAAIDGLISTATLEFLNIQVNAKPWATALSYEYKTKQIPRTRPTPIRSLKFEIPSADKAGKFIPSSSSDGGFIVAKLDPYTEEFIKYAATCDRKSLNIGCGYGIPERLSLLLGANSIICNDICTEHLTIIKKLTPQDYHSKLKFISGSFPGNVNLPNESIDLIGIFRLLHFFDPETVVLAIKKAYDLLSPNGILILSAETPYLGNWQNFIPEYEHRIAQKNPWPGYISDTLAYETAGYSRQLPPKMNFLDVATLTRVLTENGFSIIKCATFSRADTFPESLLLNGKESVGAIAKKHVEHVE